MTAATDPRNTLGRLARSPKWAVLPLFILEAAALQLYCYRLQYLPLAHRWQAARKTAGQHGLASTRQTDPQFIVSACSGHIQRPASLLLTLTMCQELIKSRYFWNKIWWTAFVDIERRALRPKRAYGRGRAGNLVFCITPADTVRH